LVLRMAMARIFEKMSVNGGALMSGSEARAQARVVAGRYRLLRVLGRGGMGVVWLADDQLVDRKVAVKELRPPPGLPDADREVFAVRALREARNAARIHHPNAVTLYDVLPVTAADEAVYLIMEYVEGPTLADLVGRDGPVADAAVASLGVQLLDVLAAAHGLGVVHRDVKPGNVMVAAGNQVKLTDFGIAHTLGSTRLTHSGTMGTPAYMAPELFGDQPISPAADLWSVGATLYYAVAGQGPFDRQTTAAAVGAILVDDIPVPSCLPGLAAAISGLLQRDPAQRATIEQARAQLLAAARPVADREPASEPPGHPVPEKERRAASRARRPEQLLPPPPEDPAVFSDLRGYFAVALVRAVWLIAIIGGAVGFYVIAITGGIGPGALAFALYCVLGFLGSAIALRSVTRRRMLVLDSSGLAVDIATLKRNHYRIAQARWEQVVRIGSFGPPSKVSLYAWISVGESEPAKLVRLCPLGSPHFPIGEILAAMQSYCPTVSIEPPLQDRAVGP
jgi:tRNA A-37 threonylcarbamoyl transferase component Bud32